MRKQCVQICYGTGSVSLYDRECVLISDTLMSAPSPVFISTCLMFQTVLQCRKRKLRLGSLLSYCFTGICCTWHEMKWARFRNVESKHCRQRLGYNAGSFLKCNISLIIPLMWDGESECLNRTRLVIQICDSLSLLFRKPGQNSCCPPTWGQEKFWAGRSWNHFHCTSNNNHHRCARYYDDHEHHVGKSWSSHCGPNPVRTREDGGHGDCWTEHHR